MCVRKIDRGRRGRGEGAESESRMGDCVCFGCITCKMIDIIAEILINTSLSASVL